MSDDVLEGAVRRITFYNEETGYTVLRIKPSAPPPAFHLDAVNSEGLVTVVGKIGQIAVGELLELSGSWIVHSEFGKQFSAVSATRSLPTSPEAIARYLASKIKGVGKTTASAIVDHFGDDTLRVLDFEPERLYEVPGIGAYRVKTIIRGWQSQKDEQELMLFLEGNGLPTSLAIRVAQQYGSDTIAVIEDDPYRLQRDVYGIGFKIADAFARSMGLSYDHPNRIKAGVEYTLERALGEGHVFLPENTLIEQAVELLEVDYDMVIAAVERAIREELVTVDILPVEEGEGIRAIYLPMYYASEVGTANRIRRLFNHSGSRLQDIRQLGLEAEIERIAAWNDISLTDQQQAAVKAAVVNKVSILTGGPGTGKTTTLRTLIDVLRHGGFTFALASPTGRAAKRLSEATGEPASTIHRLLGFSAQGGFAYDDTNPLNYDMVIVDEASMLDIILANALTRALDPRSHLLLVGDSDQLPSVGAGDVLRDLTASGHVPITRLNVIFRQGKGSTIIENAHRINAGLPLEPASDGDGNLFHFKIDDDAERAADLIVDVVANRIPQRFGFDPLDDVQVLIPMYRGPAGITAMNDRLQQALNRRGQTAETRLGDRVYRVGDKVIQTRNNYDKEVFNGDIGRIATIDFNEKMLMVNFEDGRQPVEYDWSETSELMHAYAISVHRSQGSEYPVVVMPVITQYYMLLQRNLLYTAVTRAKKLVVLVGSEKAIRIAVGNDAVSRRYTALDLRLQPESHSDSRFRF